MKINEVEQLVGITKKNIRFYEDQGLLEPERNKANGYREYSEENVNQLLRIKLLRKLSVPIEEIRRVSAGYITLEECLERHRIVLNHEARNIRIMMELCDSLSEEQAAFNDLNAEAYLKIIEEKERGGIQFMNVSKTDVAEKKRSAVIAASVMLVIVLMWDILVVYFNTIEPLPLFINLLWIIPANAVIIGILIALFERIKEIDKGEENEARKY